MKTIRHFLNVFHKSLKTEFICLFIPKIIPVIQSWIFNKKKSFKNHSNVLICSQETFTIIVNVENSCPAQYFCGDTFLGFFGE